MDCYLILADLELVMERWAEFKERSVGRRIFRLGFDLALSRRKGLFVVVSHSCKTSLRGHINSAFIKSFCITSNQYKKYSLHQTFLLHSLPIHLPLPSIKPHPKNALMQRYNNKTKNAILKVNKQSQVGRSVHQQKSSLNPP